MLFLFLEHHHVPNKFWIFVGHNNVKDRLSVKRIGLQVPAIFTKTTKAKFSFTSCCEDVNLQVFVYSFCSTCSRSPRVPAKAAGGGWLEKEQLEQSFDSYPVMVWAVSYVQQHR